MYALRLEDSSSLYFFYIGSTSVIRNNYSVLLNGRLLFCVPLSPRSLSSATSILPDPNSTSSGTCRHCVLPSAALTFRSNVGFFRVPPDKRLVPWSSTSIPAVTAFCPLRHSHSGSTYASLEFRQRPCASFEFQLHSRALPSATHTTICPFSKGCFFCQLCCRCSSPCIGFVTRSSDPGRS